MHGRHVALLRGINVGGKNKLPMAELREMFEAEGCADVRTYIQSGNVVFEADEDLGPTLPEAITARIADRFGYQVPVMVRSAAEMRDVVERHAFAAEAEAESHLHVGFLAVAPDAAAIARLDPSRSDVDSFRVDGREVFLHVPGGMGRTKLTTDWFDRRLGTPMTVRNWRTVSELVEMATGS